jgi:hypothetical protein
MQNQIKNQGSSEGKLGPVVRYVALSVVFVFGILSIIASNGTPAKKKPNPYGLQTNEELRAEINSLQQQIRRIQQDDKSYQELLKGGFPVRPGDEDSVAHQGRMAEIQGRKDRINDIKRELQRRGPEE